jgi:HK97 family phage prohead protease
MATDHIEPVTYARSWALDDIHILRAADGYGDGRTVEAYASVFDTPTEITDRYGHYFEVIDRRAFNRQIGLGIDRVGVYYHHGMTIHGTPSDLGSVPIGSPVEIRADGKGLRTVTRYNSTPLAESVLEAIRHGDIKGYSFSGPVFKSNPTRVPRVSRSARPPTVTRLELGLAEYGPTPKPAYVEAGILAMRALQMIASTTPDQPDQETQDTTPDPGPGDAEDQRARALRSARVQEVFLDLAREKERRNGSQEERDSD